MIQHSCVRFRSSFSAAEVMHAPRVSAIIRRRTSGAEFQHEYAFACAYRSGIPSLVRHRGDFEWINIVQTATVVIRGVASLSSSAPPSWRCRASFHGRSGSEIRDSTSAYYARLAHRRVHGGCVDPFRRSSYLSTFVTRSASSDRP